jgi:hypothetical protein
MAVALMSPLLFSGCSVTRGNCEQVSLTERERCMAANEDSRSKVEARKKERKQAAAGLAVESTDEQDDSPDRKWIP